MKDITDSNKVKMRTNPIHAKLNKNTIPYPQPLQYIIGDQLFELYRPFKYVWTSDGEFYRIVIPPKFIYDGASVPRIAWTLIGLRPVGLISASACIHDYSYANGGNFKSAYEILDQETSIWQTCHGIWTKEQSDKLFAIMLREAGVGKLKRRLAYQAVRIFGSSRFENVS